MVDPRGDGHVVGERMSGDEAAEYHGWQIGVLRDAGAQRITALTLTYPEEAIGVVQAAAAAGLPVVPSFTVETDGRLPDGTPVAEAVQRVDRATGGAADFFMINCAHPTHIAAALDKRAERRSDQRVVRRPAAAVLIISSLTAGASVPVETASGAAGLRVRDRLTFTHRDGTPLAFRPQLRVWCGPWASDVPVPSIHVRVGSRSRAGLTHWELHAVLADVRRRPLVRLPNAFVFDHPKGALVFATDGRNEVNSDTQRSSGRIRFVRAGCGQRLQVAFRIGGRLGSELSDGEPITVRGSFSASTSQP